MSIENFYISGIGNAKLGDGVTNPGDKSTLLDFGENVLIVRPVEGGSHQEELSRRQRAVDIYTTYLSKYTPECDFVVLQGRKLDTGEDVPMLGRFTKKRDEVRPITEMPDIDIVSDAYMCQAMLEIYKAYLYILLSEKKIMDYGKNGNFGKDMLWPFPGVLRYMVTTNTMTYRDNSDSKKLFCDPDWYSELSELDGVLAKIKRFGIELSLMTSRIVFFQALVLVHRIRSALK